MVLGAVVLELDVETVLDAHLHLDRVVDLGRWLREETELVWNHMTKLLGHFQDHKLPSVAEQTLAKRDCASYYRGTSLIRNAHSPRTTIWP